MKKDFILIIFVSLLMFGCFSSTGVMQIMDSAGNVVATVSDAAAQRDWIYSQALINRDTMTEKMYAKSGVKIVMEKYTLKDGSMMLAPKEFTVRGAPQFQQNLATTPPDHRGWDTADKIIDFATFGLGAYFLNDFGKHAVSSAAPTYYGDFNMNSLNPTSTAAPYFPPEYLIPSPTVPLRY